MIDVSLISIDKWWFVTMEKRMKKGELYGIEIKGSVKPRTFYFRQVSPNSVGILAPSYFVAVDAMYRDKIDIYSNVLIGIYRIATKYSFFIKDESKRHQFYNKFEAISIA